MLVFGFLIMSSIEFLVGLYQLADKPSVASMLVLVFIIGYEFSAGPVLWVYIPEVLNKAGVTLMAVANWVFIIVVSLVTPAIQDATGPWIFFIFGMCNVAGALFQLVFLKESKGKSRYDLQQMYSAKATQDDYRLLLVEE